MDGFPARFSRGFACIPFVKYDFYFAGRFVWCRPCVVRWCVQPVSAHSLFFRATFCAFVLGYMFSTPALAWQALLRCPPGAGPQLFPLFSVLKEKNKVGVLAWWVGHRTNTDKHPACLRESNAQAPPILVQAVSVNNVEYARNVPRTPSLAPNAQSTAGVGPPGGADSYGRQRRAEDEQPARRRQVHPRDAALGRGNRRSLPQPQPQRQGRPQS